MVWYKIIKFYERLNKFFTLTLLISYSTQSTLAIKKMRKVEESTEVRSRV